MPRKKASKKKTKLSEEDVEEQLQRIVSTNRNMMRFHLSKVKETTGEILVSDVDYCLDLSDRIINHAKTHYNGKI